ncbi:MAG: penicillin-insensitive murein endopeptidase [Gaiellaceae bacterium]
MLRRLALSAGLAALVLVTAGWPDPGGRPIVKPVEAQPQSAIEWRSSRSYGLHWSGRLVRGVQLPAEGATFFTWDPVRKRSPNRGWRRVGNNRLVETVLRVLDDFVEAHPDAPRIGVGDLSRPGGGDFGARYGLPGHVSHQNGLDADLYYPRHDGRERAPTSPRQIDRPLAQDLVDRFVRAGASKVFVGPRTGLRGPPEIVQALPRHDNHLHVRLGTAPVRGALLGRSSRGRPIRLHRLGAPDARERVLVVGCIHGTECAGLAVTRRLLLAGAPAGIAFWIVPNLNPDGLVRGTRVNGRGVDLNRNFRSEWKPIGRPWGPQYSGPRPWSEPEARLARDLILRLRPTISIWFHQPQAVVRAWGPSVRAARRYARLAQEPFRALRWPNGTAPNWQNHRFPGMSAFVVELPPGSLSARAAERHVRAILGLARSDSN